MAQLALGLAGAAVGSFFGPIGASIGWSIGAAIGSTFEPNRQVYGPRLQDLHVGGSSYGSFILRGWGAFRTGSNMIDQTDLVETEHTSGGGKGGGGGVETHSFTYSVSCDAAICEGPIGEVRKIWADGRLIFDTSQDSTAEVAGVPVTFYLGAETQLADPTFEGERGAGNVPPYRGICHAVFANWELGPFGNRIPQLNFEVTTQSTEPGVYNIRYRNDLPIDFGGFVTGSYLDFRYGPRITAAGLGGTIDIEMHGVRGGNVVLDAATLDIQSAHLTIAENSALADVHNSTSGGDAYVYCGDYAGAAVWLNATGYAITGAGATYPTISTIQPTFPVGIPTGSGDVAYAWGIPIGQVPKAIVLSQDGLMAFVMVLSTPGTPIGSPPHYTDPPDIWYKVIGGVIVAQGTIASDAKLVTYGNFSHSMTSTFSSSTFENNYRWMWHTQNDGIVFVCHIDDAGVFRKDPGTFAANLILWPHETFANQGAYNLKGDDGSGGDFPNPTRIGIPATPTDDTPTADAPADWPPAFFPATSHSSILALPTETYCAIALSHFVAIIRRVRSLGDGTTLDVIVGDLCQIVKDAAEAITGQASTFDWDVTDLEGIPVLGFILTSQMTARAAIESLMAVYFFDAVESDAIVKFRLRGHASVATIPDDDLAAHSDSDDIPPLLSRVRRQEQDLPATMTLTYIDVDRDYQIGSQTSRRMVGGSSEVITVQAPVVFIASEAKQRCDALLYSTWLERDSFQWQTTRKYVYLEPTDVVTVGSGAKVLRITRKTEGADGVVAFEGVPSFGPVFSQSGSGGGSGEGFPEQTPPEAQLTDLELLDIPYLTINPDTGCYYAGMAGAARRSWLGASLQRSIDGGVNYSEVLAWDIPATMGDASTILGDFFGGNVYDEVNSVTVVLRPGAGELESVSRAAALTPEVNECVLGDEILRFREATLIAERTYVLSGLLRGRRGTEWAMGTHAVDDRFVMLPVPIIAPVALSDLHLERQYKAVTFGSTVASAIAEPFTWNSRSQLPYSPVYLRGHQASGGDWYLYFKRRTRYGGEWIDYVDADVGEASELYRIRIWSDATYTIQKRQMSALPALTIYTAAEQIADFGSPQSVLYWTAEQIGAIGPGYDSLGRAPA